MGALELSSPEDRAATEVGLEILEWTSGTEFRTCTGDWAEPEPAGPDEALSPGKSFTLPCDFTDLALTIDLVVRQEPRFASYSPDVALIGDRGFPLFAPEQDFQWR